MSPGLVSSCGFKQFLLSLCQAGLQCADAQMRKLGTISSQPPRELHSETRHQGPPVAFSGLMTPKGSDARRVAWQRLSLGHNEMLKANDGVSCFKGTGS